MMSHGGDYTDLQRGACATARPCMHSFKPHSFSNSLVISDPKFPHVLQRPHLSGTWPLPDLLLTLYQYTSLYVPITCHCFPKVIPAFTCLYYGHFTWSLLLLLFSPGPPDSACCLPLLPELCSLSLCVLSSPELGDLWLFFMHWQSWEKSAAETVMLIDMQWVFFPLMSQKYSDCSTKIMEAYITAS